MEEIYKNAHAAIRESPEAKTAQKKEVQPKRSALVPNKLLLIQACK